MEIKDIYFDLIHNKNQKKLLNYEKDLLEKIKNTELIEELEELYFLLIVTKVENSYVESLRIKQILTKYLSILKKIELGKKCKKRRYGIFKKKKDYSLIVFYNTMISRLHYLENLYSKNYSSDYSQSIRKIKFDYKKDLYYENKKIFKYISYSIYKWLTGYGNGIDNLAITSGSILFIFSLIFYIYDIYFPGTLTAGFPGMEGIGVANFEYYIYLSTNIFSNLGADGNLAITPFLRLLFDIEQILGVLSFGLFIFIMGKKL